jgi:hypothetical protein
VDNNLHISSTSYEITHQNLHQKRELPMRA